MAGNIAAAAELPPIEETEEVWNDDGDVEVLPDHGKEPPVPAVETEDDPEPDADPETPPTVEAETTPEDAPQAELTVAEQKAKAFDDMAAAFTRDPVSQMQAFLQMLTPEQRAAAGFVQPAATKVDPLWDDAEDTTPAEKFIKSKANIINDLPRWSQKIESVATVHERALISHDADLAALNAKLDAVALAMGLELPAAKSMADAKARADYAAETKAAATKLKLVRTAKETQTPSTPRNQAGGGASAGTGVLEAKPGETMMQLFRRAKAQAGVK